MQRLGAALLTALVATIGVLPTASAAAAPDPRGSTVRLEPRVISVDGVRTSYALLGSDSSTPLLLLNGTGSPMSQWDPALLGALSRDHRVVVYDYPGLGGSSALPGRLTFDALATHAAGLLAALGQPTADVLGWSMGGFVAQRLAVRFPASIRTLVLAATNPGGPRAVLGPAWVRAEDSDAHGTARGYVRANYPPGARDRGWAFVRRVNSAIDEGRYPPDRVPEDTYAAMVAAEDPWLASETNLQQLGALTLPVLVITGGDDVVTPVPNSRILAAAVPEATLRLVAHAGHSFLFQRPNQVARLITGFTR